MMNSKEYEKEIQDFSREIADFKILVDEKNAELDRQDQDITCLHTIINKLEDELEAIDAQREYAAILAIKAVTHFGAYPYALGCGWFENNGLLYAVLEAPGNIRTIWHMRVVDPSLVKTSLRHVKVPPNENLVSSREEACTDVIQFSLEDYPSEIK
jgi:hypothetical protein